MPVFLPSAGRASFQTLSRLLDPDPIFQCLYVRRNGAGFEPYANNGGTVVAVAGRDYCIIAADSRLSDGYTILSRNVSRVHQLSGDTHLATAGCWADTQGLLRLLRVRFSHSNRERYCEACTEMQR